MSPRDVITASRDRDTTPESGVSLSDGAGGPALGRARVESARIERRLARSREEFFASLREEKDLAEHLAESPTPILGIGDASARLDPAQRAARETLIAVELERRRLAPRETDKEQCLRCYGKLINRLDVADSLAASSVSEALRRAIVLLERDEILPDEILEHLVVGIDRFFEAFSKGLPPAALARQYTFLEGPPGEVSQEIKDAIDSEIEPVIDAIEETLEGLAERAVDVVDTAVANNTIYMARKAETVLYENSLLGRLNRVWTTFFGSSKGGGAFREDIKERESLRPAQTDKHRNWKLRFANNLHRAAVHSEESDEPARRPAAEALQGYAEEGRSGKIEDLRQELRYNEQTIASGTDPAHMHARLTREERGEILATIERIKRELTRLGHGPRA